MKLLVNLATEDELSEAVAARIVSICLGNDAVGLKLRRNGNGYLRTRLPNFRQMAERMPVLVVTDLDRIACAPALIAQWSGPNPIPPQLMLRVAVREIEAWILADRVRFADFLGISANLIPLNPELLPDPKNFLLTLAKRARRELRSDLIVSRGAAAVQGLGYNRVLCEFVTNHWDLVSASEASDSLRRAVNRLNQIVAQ